MGKKIFVVTSGDYSDYHIVDIFSKKSKAQLIVDTFNNCRIEEYEIDPMETYQLKKGYKFYRIEVFEDGEILKHHTYKSDDGKYTKEGKLSISEEHDALSSWEIDILNNPTIKKYEKSSMDCFVSNHPNKEGMLYMDIIVQARDEDHAVKIANEKRIQLKANNLFYKTNNG